ncbi:Na+ ATPase [Linnemannia gamsii]|uniref:Na+ ATPase n=1 Tax=Linnemannia gamsii TaxID=64522 RepID=A0A9P6QRB2_9FUNG|nr:Na+ ATPase [Linnemannia gamsii]
MVFSSTTVVKGRAKGIVTNTGMKTQIGKIATTLMSVDADEQTPLQKRLNKMAYFVFLAALILVLIVFAVHKFQYSNEVAIYAISGDIFRQGESTDGKNYEQDEQIPSGTGSNNYLRMIQTASLCNMSELRRTQHPETHGEWTAIGDPTEIALQVLAYKAGLAKPDLVAQGFKLIAEFPFDSSVKRMSVLYQTPESHMGPSEHLIFMKGATERVIGCCNYWRDGDNEHPINSEKGADGRDAFEAMITEKMNALAEKGLRVLTLAYRKFEAAPDVDLVHGLVREEVESDMVFLGLVGIYDPPRAESRPAVLSCYQAGVRVHMLTGDHPSTAAAIAKEVAIIPEELDAANSPLVMTAGQFDAMTDEQIDSLDELPRVVARCSPNTKVKMIAALHRRDLFAAMTGDGVNDSPSLKAANVGIAMGQSGSDVAKQAADIVLTDDNFATIVQAVAEGRRMFANIQKFVQHLMSANVAEIVVLIIGLAFKDDDGNAVFPMSAVEILFLNMITSSPPAMGLGLEPPSESNMREPPRSAKQGLFSFEVVMDTFIYGLAMGILSFVNFVIVVIALNDANFGSECNAHYSPSCEGVFKARATAYATLTFLILAHAINCRSLRERGWTYANLSTLKQNKMLWVSIVVGSLLVFPVIYIPGVNHNVFKHSSLSYEWGLVACALVLFIAFAEIYKLIKRRVMKPLSLQNSAEVTLDRSTTGVDSFMAK